jgi:hypothetical protein
MNRMCALVVSFVLAFGLLAIAGCDWSAVNTNQEKEEDIYCSLNAGSKDHVYSCSDVCCGWNTCGSPSMYIDYPDCVNQCDTALDDPELTDSPNQSEKYKNCVLDCVSGCAKPAECQATCAALYPPAL